MTDDRLDTELFEHIHRNSTDDFNALADQLKTWVDNLRRNQGKTLRALRPGESCGEFFRKWQRALEHKPVQYSLRFLPTNQRWLNSVARKFWGIVRPIDSWEHAIRWLHHDDVAKLENAHSRALKFWREEHVTIRARHQPHKFVKVINIVAPERCRQCQMLCVVMITRILICGGPVALD